MKTHMIDEHKITLFWKGFSIKLLVSRMVKNPETDIRNRQSNLFLWVLQLRRNVKVKDMSAEKLFLTHIFIRWLDYINVVKMVVDASDFHFHFHFVGEGLISFEDK